MTIPFMHSDSRIYIAGHRGLVGSAIHRELLRQGFRNILTRTHEELDLLDKLAVDAFFTAERPDFVFLAAARVGGILANSTYPADFIRDNLVLQTNVIEASRNAGVKRLLFLGSSCIYPRLCPQPIKEEYLLTGPQLLSYADVAAALSQVLARPIAFYERTFQEDKQAMIDVGVSAVIAEMNALAVSLIADGEAAWLSPDVPTVLGRPARSFEQFATDHAAAFTQGG